MTSNNLNNDYFRETVVGLTMIRATWLLLGFSTVTFSDLALRGSGMLKKQNFLSTTAVALLLHNNWFKLVK